ncbi:MAG: TonB-dependent hemoglobin/transferrin/lactoferrin family receptor [Sneathiella sp.]|nr:TonB-dependent hemoglobin/transferrin/lactoferrin family receptor [Sneathiella sp.]
MRHVSCVPLIGALLSSTFLSTAVAQEKIPVTSLDTVTVYATRSEQSTFDVPAIVSIVDVDAPGAALSGDIGDLLEFTPGVEVDNGPRRNGQTISIRGFDDEAIITLIDGRRQNFESAHDGRFFVDPSLLKKVEIVKGASSAIYGGGAVGGVIAFETKDASDILAPGDDFGVTTTAGYRSGNREIAPVVSAYGRTGNFDILGSLAYKTSGDIRTGGGDELDTEDNVLSGMLKLGYTAADWHTFKFQYQGLNNSGQEPNNGAGGISTSNPIVDKDVQDNQFGLKYAYDNPDNALLNLKFHTYFNDIEVEEEDITGSNAGRVQSRSIQTLGFTADNQSRFSFSDTNDHTLSFGLEIYRDEQEGSSTATIDGSRAGVPDAETLNYGFYVQDEISVSTSFGKFMIIPAARFDRFQSEDNDGNEQDESAVSPKISLSYKPTENFVFFSSLAQAFRAPNMTELYASGVHFPGIPFVFPDNNFIPNPDLKPETVTTFEVGAGINFKSVLAGHDQVKIKGSWYRSKGEDFITQSVDVFAGTTTNSNIDNAKLWGWEVEGEYAIHPFKARAGLSYVNAKDEDTGEYLSNNVPLTLVTDFSYAVDSISSLVGWRSRYADENDNVGSGEIPTDGYGVHDLYYRWAPIEGRLQNLTLDLGVENIFDRRYQKRFATLNEEGRSYVARVSVKW